MANDPVESAKIKAPPKKQQAQPPAPPPPPPASPAPVARVGDEEPTGPSLPGPRSYKVASAPRYVSWQGQLIQLKAGQVLHTHVYTEAGIEQLRKQGVKLDVVE